MLFRAGRAAQALNRRARRQRLLSRRRARRRRSRGHRNRLGPTVPREVQPARSAEVVSGGAPGRCRVGAGARRPRARAARTRIRRRRPQRPRRGDRDRSAARRPPPAARGPSSRRRSRARRARSSTRSWPSIRRSLEAHAMLAAMAYVQGRPGRLRCGGREGPRDQSELRRGLPRRRPNRRPATTASTRPRRSRQKALALDPTSSRARRRSRHAPDAHRRRARRAPRPRSRVPRRSLRQRRPTTCSSCSTSSTSSSTVRDGDFIFRCTATRRRCCASTRCRSRRTRSQTLSARYEFTPTGPDPGRDLPEARRLRRPQPRPARHDRRARRLLRPRRHAGLAAARGRRGRSAGRRRSGTSWRTSSRCRCRSSGSRAG